MNAAEGGTSCVGNDHAGLDAAARLAQRLGEPLPRHGCRDSGRVGREHLGGDAAHGLVGGNLFGAGKERIAGQAGQL